MKYANACCKGNIGLAGACHTCGVIYDVEAWKAWLPGFQPAEDQGRAGRPAAAQRGRMKDARTPPPTPGVWPGIIRVLIETWALHESQETGRVVRPGGLSQRKLSYGRIYTLISTGKDITYLKAEQALREISSQWPAGLEWPRSVPRPAPENFPVPASLEPPTPA